MWVAPHARGTGVADALVAAVIAWATERGINTIALDVVETNAGHAHSTAARASPMADASPIRDPRNPERRMLWSRR